MRIVLLEDDPSQSEWIVAELEREFPGIHVEVVETEEAFRARLPEFAMHPPNRFLLDVMVRWTNPSPDITPPPEDVQLGKAFRAGIRCRRLLANNPQLKDVRSILYTILNHSDLKADIEQLKEESIEVIHVPKDADPKDLFQKIRAHQ